MHWYNGPLQHASFDFYKFTVITVIKMYIEPRIQLKYFLNSAGWNGCNFSFSLFGAFDISFASV